MDDTAIATAIWTRLAAVTPPAGESAVRWAGHTLPETPVAARPAVELLPPDEVLDWGVGGRMVSVTTWKARLLLGQAADLPRRMTSLYAWRTAVRSQLAGQVQLGIGQGTSALLTGMRVAVDEIEVCLELTIRVTVRETVPMTA